MSTQSNLRAVGRAICTNYVSGFYEVFDGRGINVHINTDFIELPQKRALQHKYLRSK